MVSNWYMCSRQKRGTNRALASSCVNWKFVQTVVVGVELLNV